MATGARLCGDRVQHVDAVLLMCTMLPRLRRKYRAEILEVTIERKAVGQLLPRLLNVSDVLDLTVSEAQLSLIRL
jgi:excinuclease UvrABC ATPase subunit